MSLTDLRYDITRDEDVHWRHPIAVNNRCLLPPWAAHDGEEAAKAIAIEHMRDCWNDHIDEPDDDVPVRVRITAPEGAAGIYAVDLTKKIVASGVRKMEGT